MNIEIYDVFIEKNWKNCYIKILVSPENEKEIQTLEKTDFFNLYKEVEKLRKIKTLVDIFITSIKNNTNKVKNDMNNLCSVDQRAVIENLNATSLCDFEDNYEKLN